MLPNIQKKQAVYRILKIGLPLLVVLFLGCTSFSVFKVDFRYVAVRKSIIFGVYGLQLVIIEQARSQPVAAKGGKRGGQNH